MICQINGALTFFVYYFNWFFLRLIITCRLWVIYVREDNYSNVQVMIKWLIWTIWTPMSSVLKKADKLNLSLSPYSYFLSGNKYRKNITCKNIGQFQFCINLLPLELIWRSASCPRHWNQRWFGDAAFTIPSGKQWDHMSPWPPSWLSAGIDECCRSANESGHQWLKKLLAGNDLTLDQ